MSERSYPPVPRPPGGAPPPPAKPVPMPDAVALPRMTTSEMYAALQLIAEWIDSEREMIELYYDYAQRFCAPVFSGQNIYELVLADALRYRGITLAQFASGIEDKNTHS